MQSYAAPSPDYRGSIFLVWGGRVGWLTNSKEETCEVFFSFLISVMKKIIMNCITFRVDIPVRIKHDFYSVL